MYRGAGTSFGTGGLSPPSPKHDLVWAFFHICMLLFAYTAEYSPHPV